MMRLGALSRASWLAFLQVALIIVQKCRALGGEDYRQVPLAGGDISFHVNAVSLTLNRPLDGYSPSISPAEKYGMIALSMQVCESRGRVFVGGELNRVGEDESFNFGYFDPSGSFVSPPVSIGADPSTLMYSWLTYGPPLESSIWAGKGQ